MPEARPLRLLLSASDPGAAMHIFELEKHVRGNGQFAAALLAGPPALGIFQRAGIAVRVFAAGRTGQDSAEGVVDILAEAARHIESLRPDALLVGLSGPDRGLDEALVAQAGTIPTYAVQDFWGDVNPGFGKLPGTYLVMDELAAGMTRLRAPSARIMVTGSARHAATAAIDTMQLRDAFRSRWNAPASRPIAVFFGQPLHGIRGYGLALAGAAAAWARVCPGATLLYRPHPKEDAAGHRDALERLAAPGLTVAIDEGPDVAQSLCGADLAFTCFSSCGLDLAHLNRASPFPLAPTLFLLCEADLQRHFRKTNRLDDMPLSTQGLAATVWKEKDIKNAIADALNQSERERVWKSVREKIADPSKSLERIASTIAEDFSPDFD